MNRYCVIFLSGRGLRDRLYTDEAFGRNYIYFAEPPREGAGIDFSNPPQVMFCDDVKTQEALALGLTRRHPGCTVIKAESKEIINSVMPTDIKIKRSAWSEKGLLPS